MEYVKFTNVSKRYPKMDVDAVKNFNLEINKGEFIVFVGPSGCAKSTTLRMLAGLEDITSGKIEIDGIIVNDIHPKDRDIAMVFQNYALYPHMSVRENISFGLKIKKLPKQTINEKVDWAANVLGLEEYLERKPKDLSGGQRQRVALGRAIVRNPKVFLMDEPLSNLDAKLRVTMRNEITKLHRDLGATTIYVTHDQVEAMTMADRIVVMKDGIIQQIGTPMNLYLEPKNLFVATFIGAPQMNLLNVSIVGNHIILEDGTKILLQDDIKKKFNESTKNIIMGIRPEDIDVISNITISNKEEVLETEILNIEHMGYDNHIFTKLGLSNIILKVSGLFEKKVGENCLYCIDINKAHFFDLNTTERL